MFIIIEARVHDGLKRVSNHTEYSRLLHHGVEFFYGYPVHEYTNLLIYKTINQLTPDTQPRIAAYSTIVRHSLSPIVYSYRRKSNVCDNA